MRPWVSGMRRRGKYSGLMKFSRASGFSPVLPRISMRVSQLFDGGVALVEMQGATTSGMAAILACFIDQARLHDASRARVGERVNQDRVDDAEDGAGSAGSQGQGEHCGQREARALPQFAGGIAQISGQRLHRHLAWQPLCLRRPLEDRRRRSPEGLRQSAPITVYLCNDGETFL